MCVCIYIYTHTHTHTYFHTNTSAGPVMLTRDQLNDVDNLKIETWVNDVLVQVVCVCTRVCVRACICVRVCKCCM